MESLALHQGQIGKPPEEELSGQRMNTHPFAVDAFNENWRRTTKLEQRFACPLIVCERNAERRINHLQQGDACEEVNLFDRQTDDQAINEITLDIARAGRQLFDGRAQVWAFLDRSNRQLQPQWPAFGDFLQAYTEVRVDARTETVAENSHGFLGTKTQQIGRYRDVQTPCK
ncbi:hypothetical protein D3C75_1018320 [compost metagenome]